MAPMPMILPNINWRAVSVDSSTSTTRDAFSRVTPLTTQPPYVCSNRNRAMLMKMAVPTRPLVSSSSDGSVRLSTAGGSWDTAAAISSGDSPASAKPWVRAMSARRTLTTAARSESSPASIGSSTTMADAPSRRARSASPESTAARAAASSSTGDDVDSCADGGADGVVAIDGCRGRFPDDGDVDRRLARAADEVGDRDDGGDGDDADRRAGSRSPSSETPRRSRVERPGRPGGRGGSPLFTCHGWLTRSSSRRSLACPRRRGDRRARGRPRQAFAVRIQSG